MELKRVFGRRVKTLRELRRLTQGELAAQLERSVDAVSMIERGKNWPSAATIEALAIALKVDTAELFDDLSASGASPDYILVARELLKQLGHRDLEVAVAMLQTMVENAPKAKGRRP